MVPFREQYELAEDLKTNTERLMEEIRSRIGVPISYDAYVENQVIAPLPTGKTIHFVIEVGRYKRVGVISDAEINATMHEAQTWYYFVRRTADQLMMDLIRIGAERA